MIYVCSYVAALLESLSRFTRHVTTGGAKCLFLHLQALVYICSFQLILLYGMLLH